MLWITLIWLWNGANLSIYEHVKHFVPNIRHKARPIAHIPKRMLTDNLSMGPTTQLKAGIIFSVINICFGLSLYTAAIGFLDLDFFTLKCFLFFVFLFVFF